MKPWPKAHLGEVLKQIERPESVDASSEYRLLGVRWYGQGLFVKDVKSGQQIKANRLYRIQEGDFVYNRLFAWKGSFAVARPELGGCYVSNEFPCFQPDRNRLDADFLLWFSRREGFWGKALGLSTGATPTSRNRLKEANFLNLEIPLPPLQEQQRIVARIEELSSLIDEARTLREQAAVNTEALHASYANALFTGKGSHLWPKKALGEIAEIRSGVTLGRRLVGKTIRLPYLRVANVQDGHLDLSTIKEVEVLESEADKWKLVAGDLLLTEGGDWDELGRGTIWRGEIRNCIHQNHIFRLRTRSDEFIPEFLAALIGSPIGKKYFQDASKQTTNLASINQAQLKAFPVFGPPLSEQLRAVAELRDIQSQVKDLRKLQSRSTSELETMLPAILDRAFRGIL